MMKVFAKSVITPQGVSGIFEMIQKRIGLALIKLPGTQPKRTKIAGFTCIARWVNNEDCLALEADFNNNGKPVRLTSLIPHEEPSELQYYEPVPESRIEKCIKTFENWISQGLLQPYSWDLETLGYNHAARGFAKFPACPRNWEDLNLPDDHFANLQAARIAKIKKFYDKVEDPAFIHEVKQCLKKIIANAGGPRPTKQMTQDVFTSWYGSTTRYYLGTIGQLNRLTLIEHGACERTASILVYATDSRQMRHLFEQATIFLKEDF